MEAEAAAPCRHAGASPQAIIDKVSEVVRGLGREETLLARYGITSAEFIEALPAAIEAMRGAMSAANTDRRQFLGELFKTMRSKGIIDDLVMPSYGDDTIYRLIVEDIGDIAVIQKGCPDGAHSSVRWSAPEWARETYLWWLCSSMRFHPGEHVVKGANRLRQRFLSDQPGTIDGVIFHNQLCGGPERPCPKMAYSAMIGGKPTPPPCVYVMPDRAPNADDWNWAGGRIRVFPTILLGLFGIGPSDVAAFVGHIGFQRRGGTIRSNITSHFGPGRSTTYRS